MEQKDKILKLVFWVIALIATGIITWKFFGSQDQPMETKILYVFTAFLVCALLFRWIRKRSHDEALSKWTSEAIEWSDTGISAVLLAFLIMSFVLQAFKIPSSSMEPTLLVGDHLFVNKFIYGTQVPFTLKKMWRFKEVKRYDIIVFLCPPSALSEEDRSKGIKKDFIKRAIGLPGDVIEIKNKVVYVNGEKLDDSNAHFKDGFVHQRPKLWQSQVQYQKNWEQGEFARLLSEFVRDNFGPIKVPENHYFVLGDNRDFSFDSRFWGPLDEKYIKGRAWRIYYPLKRFQLLR